MLWQSDSLCNDDLIISSFAMEIEYNQCGGSLTIKQARPWVSYCVGNSPPGNSSGTAIGLTAYPNPFCDVLHLECGCETEMSIEIYNLMGQKVADAKVDFRKSHREFYLEQSGTGVYFLQGLDKTGGQYFYGKLMKME